MVSSLAKGNAQTAALRTLAQILDDYLLQYKHLHGCFYHALFGKPKKTLRNPVEFDIFALVAIYID
tara:strand:+ start:270 stop:467 length:198 start_codon:yes stop_codon:yes gene_type:complete